MKNSILRAPVLFGYLLMSAMTIVYCVLIWYAGNALSLSIDKPETAKLPLVTLLCIIPLPLPLLWGMIHWQFLAVLSLIFCISWGLKRSGSLGGDKEHALPMVIHMAWIVFAICCHLLGAIVPILMIGHVIV